MFPRPPSADEVLPPHLDALLGLPCLEAGRPVFGSMDALGPAPPPDRLPRFRDAFDRGGL